jgi:sugar O-acyltransferase (sialic acid O-acetyltransferase NeuD family)
MTKIIIFGTEAIAELAKFYFENDSDYEVVAFTLDKDFILENEFKGKPVVPFENILDIYPPDEFKMFIAISYTNLNKLRESKYNIAKSLGYELVSYISSKCNYLTEFSIGDNCFILEDNTIQPFVKIGNNVTLWSGNHIGHHTVIHDHNFLSSQVVISGKCELKSNSFFGVNSTIAHEVIVESENIIGAGAIITKNTNEKEVFVAPRAILLAKKSNLIKI